MLSDLVKGAAEATGYNVWNIYFAWGDWSVAATVPSGRVAEFAEICAGQSIEWVTLGTATEEVRHLEAQLRGGEARRLNILRNENFVSRGFNAGLQGHLQYLLGSDLFVVD
ncbi:MAG: thiamine-monophosphate kinase [Sphingomonadales bacterium]|nr:thiamine-monophosphate kinase [Sphingomonadales bacterium]